MALVTLCPPTDQGEHETSDVAAWLTGWQQDGPSPGSVPRNNAEDVSKQMCARPAGERHLCEKGRAFWVALSESLPFSLPVSVAVKGEGWTVAVIPNW